VGVFWTLPNTPSKQANELVRNCYETASNSYRSYTMFWKSRPWSTSSKVVMKWTYEVPSPNTTVGKSTLIRQRCIWRASFQILFSSNFCCSLGCQHIILYKHEKSWLTVVLLIPKALSFQKGGRCNNVVAKLLTCDRTSARLNEKHQGAQWGSSPQHALLVISDLYTLYSHCWKNMLVYQHSVTLWWVGSVRSQTLYK